MVGAGGGRQAGLRHDPFIDDLYVPAEHAHEACYERRRGGAPASGTGGAGETSENCRLLTRAVAARLDKWEDCRVQLQSPAELPEP